MFNNKWFPLLFLVLPISFGSVLLVPKPVEAQQTRFLFNKCRKCKRAACCCPQPAVIQTQDVCPPAQPIYPPHGDVDSGQTIPPTTDDTTGDATQPDAATDTTPDVPPGFTPDATPAVQPSFALSQGTGGGAAEAIGGNEATIGDFFGSGGVVQGPSWNGINVPVAGGDRYYKLSDHTSPLPQNRVFFNYHIFGNAINDADGNNFNLTRYTFGLERAFFNKNMSFEVRIPFAYGLDSNQIETGNTGARIANTEFGNISLITKRILRRNRCSAISTGMAYTLPTAQDAFLFADDPVSTVFIANEAFKIQPFLAIHRTPNQRSWATFYSSVEFTASGNTVISNGGPPQVYTDQNLLFLDLSMGRWLYRNSDCCSTRRCCRQRRLNGIAGIMELHYTTTLNDTDTVVAGFQMGDVITNPDNRLDVINLTSGLRFNFSDRSFVTLAGVVPLRANEERLFDAEFSLQFARHF